MPEFVPVLDLQELPAQGFRAVDLNGRPILVGRVQKRLFACIDRCPHAGAPLRIGKLRGEELTCARHGWIFNVVTGSSVPHNPAFCLTQLPIQLEGSQVCVALSE